MVERRRYPRYPVHYDILLHYDILYRKIEDSFNKKKRAIVENASRTGLKIHFSGLLKRNDLLQLNIFKSLHSKPINACGKVAWQKKSPLVYGERIAGIFLTKIGWTETEKLINNTD